MRVNSDSVSHLHVLSVSDRNNPEGRPKHWLLVDRQEKPEIKAHPNKLPKATLQIRYHVITQRHHRTADALDYFCGGYSASSGSLSLSSTTPTDRTAICMPERLRGYRIGTYLMNEMVLWAHHWPKAKINPIKLLSLQAYRENKDRRNRFYKSFGFQFDYSDPEHKAGLSRPMLAEALTPVNSWKKNIRRYDLLDFLAESLYGESLGASSIALDRCRSDLSDIRLERSRAQERPVRALLAALYRRVTGF